MAMHSQILSSTISPEVVGNMFVEQYYHFLHLSPEVVFKFYHDSSVLSRPDSNGLMTSTTSLQESINEKILSMGYKYYKAEIITTDVQNTHGDGIFVLVTGSLTGKDNFKRNFTQAFFLAPQENGYFVLNDICRYIEYAEPLNTNSAYQTDDSLVQLACVSGAAKISFCSILISPLVSCFDAILCLEQARVADFAAPVPAVSYVVEKTHESADGDDVKGIKSSIVVELLSDLNDYFTSVVGGPVSSIFSDDTPKKSYASIVSSESQVSHSHGKKNSASRQEKVYVPTITEDLTSKLVPEKTEKESSESIDNPSVPEAADAYDVATENNNQHGEAEGRSVYIQNLPYDVRVAQVGAAFENFGPINTDGIQVRCHKDVGHCFGFVEFQSIDSMNKAVEASPVIVGGRRVIVEIKKTTSRAGMGKRFFQGRNTFQNENFRSRLSFSSSGGGRAYNRNEYGHRGDFSTHKSQVPLSSSGGYFQGRGGKFSQSNGQYRNSVPVPA